MEEVDDNHLYWNRTCHPANEWLCIHFSNFWISLQIIPLHKWGNGDIDGTAGTPRAGILKHSPLFCKCTSDCLCFPLKSERLWSSCCGAAGLAASLESWDAGCILCPAQRVKDPVLLQLQPRLPTGAEIWSLAQKLRMLWGGPTPRKYRKKKEWEALQL